MTITVSKSEIISGIRQLPSLPQIVQEVIASFSDENLDTLLLAQKIAHDQGLSSRMLRIANSTFYGLPRKVGSVNDAVIVLGFNSVRSIVLSIGAMQAFPVRSYGLFDRRAYWRRSARVAVLSQTLAKSAGLDQQMAFTAGMFHDVGQLVLDLCASEQFSELLGRQALSGMDLMEIERSDWGFDHAEIGAEIIRLWSFPEEIEQVIRFWHNAAQATVIPLAGIIYMAALLESGVSCKDMMARLPETFCRRLRLTAECIESALPSPEQLDAGIVSLMDE